MIVIEEMDFGEVEIEGSKEENEVKEEEGVG